jgi:hypothetical protein
MQSFWWKLAVTADYKAVLRSLWSQLSAELLLEALLLLNAARVFGV